jgi:hypothetical protein
LRAERGVVEDLVGNSARGFSLRGHHKPVGRRFRRRRQ